ncbi:MAG: dockerin type I repeat-containing protein [Clostridiales bacterium]|nr:dockerin type I repeat-containing protein [Clostridiales bacterium]
MNKRKLTAVISLILCLTLVFGSGISASAASSSAEILLGMLSGDSTSINLTDVFTTWLESEINSESTIDKFVNNIKNYFNGTTEDDPDVDDDEEEIAVIDSAEAENIAELFNITVNELKKGSPSFTKTETASMGTEISSSLQSGLGAVNGIVASVIGDTDLAAAIINGLNNDTQVTTKYLTGNDVIENIPVSGKDYVACLTADDIKDYTITVYRSGAYTIHIDLKDAEGASSQSGLAHVFNTTDKEYATINLLGGSVNVGMKFKYVDNYVECAVNRNGEITSYTQKMGITFMFEQEDGTYSTTMPYFDIDFEEEGVVYEITTEFTSIDFSLRQIGDTNNDGKVNSTDARTILRAASKLDSYEEEDEPYYDANCDGNITVADAREVLRAVSKLTTLPTASEALGLTEYEMSESTQNQINDLLVLIVAYQTAKDEAEQRELQEYYNSVYGESSDSDDSSETTTAEEPTTGTMSNTADTVIDIITDIGGFIGGLIN